MGRDSKIEWTTHTFNPWRGCTKVAAGCQNCYADAQAKRNPKTLGVWGPNGTRVVASEAMWREPLKWNKACEGWRDCSSCGGYYRSEWKTHLPLDTCAQCGERASRPRRARVFGASLADVFEDWPNIMRGAKGGYLHHGKSFYANTPYVERDDLMIGKSRVTMEDVRDRLFALVDATPNLDWLLVTKRPENIRRMWAPRCKRCHGDGTFQPRGQEEVYRCPDCLGSPLYRPNIWLLTSIANQADADRNIPELLKCRDLCPVLGVSAEPLIGPVDFASFFPVRGGEPIVGVDPSFLAMMRRKFSVEPTLNEAMNTPGVWATMEDYRAWKLANPGKPVPQLDWIIVGGESGRDARPCDYVWIGSVVSQCAAAGVPCFVKQLGSNPTIGGERFLREDGEALRDPKGGDPEEWPPTIRVRQFPVTRDSHLPAPNSP